MSAPQEMFIRDSQEADAVAVQEIYAHHVLHGLSTFEEVPPSVEEIASRRQTIVQARLPYLVAVSDEQVVGYAYASFYRPRSAYRYTIEDSVYVLNGMHGKGIGKALLGALLERCEQGDWRQMIAVIGNSGNVPSIALHQRFGFQHVGTFRQIGFKLGQWVDTVLMQRPLGMK